MKSSKELKSFTKYCEKHPELRFWQALRNSQLIIKIENIIDLL